MTEKNTKITSYNDQMEEGAEAQEHKRTFDVRAHSNTIPTVQSGMRSIIIGIDGTSATGKGTLAANLVKRYGWVHLDTGALYRAVGYQLLKQKQTPDNIPAAVKAAESLPVDKMAALQNDPALRTEQMGQWASIVSAIPGVRAALLDFQRKFAHAPVLANGRPATGAVLDGRDICTVVCPDADVKFFLTAKPEIRADRRVKQLAERAIKADFNTVLADLNARDKRDIEKAISPLKPAPDALVLDTSDMTIEGVLSKAIEFIERKKIL